MMNVKIFDIIESILVAMIVHANIKESLAQAGGFLSFVFSIGVAGIFLFLYHEKYIGVVLNLITSFLWAWYITIFLSLFSVFWGKTALMVVIFLVLLYFFLMIHGIRISAMIKSLGTLWKVSDPRVQSIFNDYNTAYSLYCNNKERAMPALSRASSDLNAPENIRQQVTSYFLSMNSIEKNNKDYEVLSRKKVISKAKRNFVESCTIQIRQITGELQGIIAADERGKQFRREQYEQSHQQQNRDQHNNNSDRTKTSSSYFNGCDSLDSLTKRYKDLCKVYHPDMGNGSAEEFDIIKKEYDALKEQYK